MRSSYLVNRIIRKRYFNGTYNVIASSHQLFLRHCLVTTNKSKTHTFLIGKAKLRFLLMGFLEDMIPMKGSIARKVVSTIGQ